MTPFDDNPDASTGQDQPAEERLQADSPSAFVPGDPIAHAAQETVHVPVPPARMLPEDLRINWSWIHFILFLFFSFASLIVVQLGVVVYFSSNHRLTQKQLQELFVNKPQIAVGTNVLWYGLIFLFLYVTIAVLRDTPFWRSLGWRKLVPTEAAPSNPWLYFFAGCGLAICVALVSSKIHTPEHMPIQELFKNRTGAILLMSMAVFVAPLVEETVFRGYLYPLFAKSFGIVPGIVVTGILFGLMHGAQLGWTWGLVLMLILVGLIFTFTRARTGTVVASFLMHLGYNSMIAVSTIIATRGFTHFPVKP